MYKLVAGNKLFKRKNYHEASTLVANETPGSYFDMEGCKSEDAEEAYAKQTTSTWKCARVKMHTQLMQDNLL